MLRVLSVIDVERGDAPLSITHGNERTDLCVMQHCPVLLSEVTLFKCKVLLIAGLYFGTRLI
jgi:hypothetical protein